jgi:PAS domain S-box-containing protein
LFSTELFIPTGFIEIDFRRHSIFWSTETNQIFERSPGFSPLSIDEFRNLIYQTTPFSNAIEILRFVVKNTPFDRIINVQTSKKKEKTLRCKGIFQKKDAEHYRRLLIIVQDITSILHLKEEYTHEQEKYNKLIDILPVGVGIIFNEKVQYYNRELLNLLGYDNESLLASNSIFDLIIPEDHERIKAVIGQRKNDKSYPLSLSFRIKRNDGSIRDIEILQTICIINGQRQYQTLVFDVTDNLKKEQAQRQMAVDALYINQKNEILIKIKNELDIILSSNGYPKKYFKKIYDTLDEATALDRDWNLMVTHFEEVYPEFFNRLLNNFPELSNNDLKHCACIKMKLSTKETARFFNVKPTSIQISRVRLRKKLKLSHKTDLRIFIQNF